LKRAQVEAGLIPESYLKRMDWMYVQSNTKGNTKEDLFGNILKPTEEPETKKKIVPIVKDSTVNEDYEAFVRFHEDPLVDIMKEQEKAKAEVLDNPLKLREIQREIELLKQGKYRKHKSKHHKKRRDSRDSSESYERSRHRRHYDDKKYRSRKERSRSREKEELGPTRELKKSYREVKEMEALKKKQKISYKHLTEEEKTQKVEEMKQDAIRGKAQLFRHEEKPEKKQINPEFIRTMRTKVYTGGEMTIEDKIKRNMHYNQRIDKVRDQNE